MFSLIPTKRVDDIEAKLDRVLDGLKDVSVRLGKIEKQAYDNKFEKTVNHLMGIEKNGVIQK